MKFNYTLKIRMNGEWVVTHEQLSVNEMREQLQYLCEEQGEQVLVIPYAVQE